MKRLVPVLDSDWSIAVFYSRQNTAMTALPKGSVYHYTTPFATTLSNVNCMFSIDIASLLPVFRFSIFHQVSSMFIIKHLFKCPMYYLVLLTVKVFP